MAEGRDLTVDLGRGLRLRSPVLVASGATSLQAWQQTFGRQVPRPLEQACRWLHLASRHSKVRLQILLTAVRQMIAA